MKTQLSYIFILVIIILTTGCKKSTVLNEQQHILFQYDYINYSSGYTHEGFYVDDDGRVLQYRNPDYWNFHAQDYNLSENQLMENISKCTVSDIKITTEEIAKYSSYIKNIASSKVTAMKNVSADAGTAVFICYEFNEQSAVYKGSLIKMEGDYTRENLNFHSKKVSLWLRDINNTLKKR